MDKLNKILAKHLGLSENKLTDDVSYDLEARWDSVTHLKMISDIEETFNIEFDIDEITSLETIGKIRELVNKKIKNGIK